MGQIHTELDPAGISYRSEWLRKSIHLCSMLIVIGYAILPRTEALLILFIMLELSFILDMERARSKLFGTFLHKYCSFMMRPHELELGKERIILTGATWVLASAVLTFAIFPKPIALAAFSMLILCDTVAALVGRRYGTIRFGKKKKSVEGSLAFLVVAVVVAALTPGLDFRVGLIGAVFAMIGEAFPGPLDDNFQVPLLSGIMMVAASSAL